MFSLLLIFAYQSPTTLSSANLSTFSLILPSSNSTQQRLLEALHYTSIPVIVGNHLLPFDDLIDWSKAVVRFPTGRLPSLIAMLRRVPPQRILEMRRAGRFYLDHYIGNEKVLTRSILSALRFRLNLPAPIEKPYFTSVLLALPPQRNPSSNVSQPNFGGSPQSIGLQQEDTYNLWNANPTFLDASPAMPLIMTPLIAGDRSNQMDSMQPINMEQHPKFGLTLSGNHPHELFTIIMLSYKRDDQVHFTLKQMDGLPFLHRIIVVWNDIDRQPPVDWPRIHVPIHVINASRNSLNNRFLPLELIETEAVFNMDDDFNVNHDDILFSFRVWRENRDVVVGPNFRLGYVKDGKGVYDASAQCQYNMVLTSGAFIHRTYLRAFTYEMPEVIRERIDELKNCEDIAINFLVSHLTRKPPIKTTPISNTKGKLSSSGLSTRHSHYRERSECILFFTKVFGYNPLVISEYRADSVLYNMNLKQCFSGT